MSFQNDSDFVASDVLETNANYVNLYLDGKSVVHLLFTWTIENFHLVPKDGKKSITSPCFHLESIPTTWYITYFPYHEKGATFYLLRSVCDEELDTVTVTFRIGVKISSTDIWFQDKRMISFGPGDVCDIKSKLGEFFDRNDELNQKPLIIVCEMYISRWKIDQYVPKEEMSIEAVDLLNLSSDMSKLIGECLVSDVVIRVKELEIASHKTILSARSPVFARMLNEECSYLNLPDEDNDHIFNVLGYVYSNNLYSYAQKANLSIGLYECAMRYSISGLKELLTPTEICSYTKINSETVEIEWKIEKSHFLNLKTGDCIQSPDFTSEEERTINWFLEIYPNGKRFSPNSVGVFLKTRELFDDLYIKVILSILVGNKVLFCRSFDDTYNFPNFISKAKLFGNKYFLNNDFKHLIINCKIKLSIPAHCIAKTSPSTMPCSPCISLPDKYIDLKHLSEDFGRMLDGGSSTNATVVVGFANFRLHKEILRARLPSLASVLKQWVNSNNCVIHLSNVSSDVFEKMIIYAYTGKLSELMPCLTIKLYQAAKDFEMEYLVKRCSHFLQSNLSIKCFFEVIVLADRYEDEQLMNKCLDFFKNNTYKVLFTDEWVILNTNHSHLTGNLILRLCDHWKSK